MLRATVPVLLRAHPIPAPGSSERSSLIEAVPHLPGIESDYIERNRAAWERWAPGHVAAGRRAWKADELRWGLWRTPESELHLLEGSTSGEEMWSTWIGTAAISACASRSLRPVADFAQAQLQTARSLQEEFNMPFPLICTNAEQLQFDGDSFDLAISEYGVSIWCDPRRWLRECTGSYVPRADSSSLRAACSFSVARRWTPRWSRETGLFATTLGVFGSIRGGRSVEFYLPHSNWIRILRSTGFVIDDLIEVQPNLGAKPRFEIVSRELGASLADREIWVARKAGL